MHSEEGMQVPKHGVRVVEGNSSTALMKKILEFEAQGWTLVSEQGERLLEDDPCFVAIMKAPFH